MREVSMVPRPDGKDAQPVQRDTDRQRRFGEDLRSVVAFVLCRSTANPFGNFANIHPVRFATGEWSVGRCDPPIPTIGLALGR